MAYFARISTGWKSLDTIIDGLRSGDNVVWQVDGIDDYQRLVSLFVNQALAAGHRVIYLRFARHTALLESRNNLTVYRLNVDSGFESFTAELHGIIAREGRDVCYVFDCLSDLLHAWATDLMIGDFFYVTCPYLFEQNTVAYFAILRNRHSFKAIARIRETTQVLIDVYNDQGSVCVHPIKVQRRYSPTMFFPHIKEKQNLVPVTSSAEATALFSRWSRRQAPAAERHLDHWDRLFMQARLLLESGAGPEEQRDMVEQLSRLMLHRGKRMLGLIRRYISLEDLLHIKERLIGTGFIGGKSVGMMLARKILAKDDALDWRERLEPHDSFFIGSDIFYSFIVQNGWWKLFLAHKTKEGYFESAAALRENMLHGGFPEEIMEQFQLMLEYFGQSPIIIRSSSLLEDAFGSAFAGKYESLFRVNQGTPEQRYEQFEEAVRRVFASAMSEDALAYRRQRGLDRRDEQMALLVQRVSGAHHKHYFFPDMAGVGLSRNPFVWKKSMDPNAGMIRLVFGLGTRAVNRVERDYPRIIAVDEPLVKPLAEMRDVRKFSQHFVDLLNLETNQTETVPLADVLEKDMPERMDLMGVRDTDALQTLADMGRPARDLRILTFDPFLTETPFVPVMKQMLATLHRTYHYPVDIEFTVNFTASGDFRVNLLQCRPFQTIGRQARPGITSKRSQATLREADILIRTEGNFMGGNLFQPLSRVIFVDPAAYSTLSLSDKYSVARLIGRLNKETGRRDDHPTLLLGPGRWGTGTPAMGVPVSFAEINHMAALGEISYQAGSLIPDLSFGAHFFHDLIETRIFYLAIYPERPEVMFNRDWLISRPNLLDHDEEVDARFREVVRVIDTTLERLVLQADVTTFRVTCARRRDNLWSASV